MREIKFRAWDKENKYMLDSKQSIARIVSKFINDGPGMQCNNLDQKDYGIENKYIIMQYTGLKDKNGKEVYEGDIVKWKQANGGILESDKNEYICYIDWFMDGWACRENAEHCGFTLGSSHIEIIGNIYETPELLKDN